MTNYTSDPWNLVDACLLAALRDVRADEEGQDAQELTATLGLFQLEFASEIDPWRLLETTFILLATALMEHVGIDRALEVAQANHDAAVKRD